ncbi:hypothetical protein GH714_041645 [Hevea brasiliensis]|uniref:DUF2921 domain-containing protein n=1 Tax=Hevea brasiliensis TaxID=3981 RepID=A0A6A6MSX0_HEVBR|nr:hypothetical protein GH714_041645 [Hevea brasiliensis]
MVPGTWYQASKFLVLTALFYANTISCSKPDIPNYSDHCASIVPESLPIAPQVTTLPFLPNQDGYYLGGDEILKHVESSRDYYSSNVRKVLLFRGLSAILKLNNVKTSSTIASLVRGTLESLSYADDSSYFEATSLLMFPLKNYNTVAAEESDNGCASGTDIAKSSLSLPLDQLRSILHHPFNLTTTLVSEGSWNAKKKQLCVVGCRISTPTNSLKDSQVEDCSMRLSLRFAAVWSIRDTNNSAGYISSNKNRDFSGYFDRIQLRSYGINGIKIPGLKYEYTLVDRVRKLCPKMQPGRSEGMQYPGNSYDMQFHVSQEFRRKKIWMGLCESCLDG